MITTQELPAGSVKDALAPELRIWNGKDTSASAKSTGSMAFRAPSAKVVWSLRILCAAALGISGYLAYAGLTGSKIAGCGGGVWDCDHVTSTRWGKWFGLPVGLGACGMYAVCLSSLAFANSRVPSLRKVVWSLLTVGGLAAGLAAIWFISLQVLVIGHYCKWCLVAHGCGLCVAGLILWKRPAAGYTTRLAVLSVLGVSVLVGGQLIYKPQTFVIETFPTPPSDSSGAIAPPLIDEGDGNSDAGDVFAPPGMDEGETEFAPPIIEEELPSEPSASMQDFPLCSC